MTETNADPRPKPWAGDMPWWRWPMRIGIVFACLVLFSWLTALMVAGNRQAAAQEQFAALGLPIDIKALAESRRLDDEVNAARIWEAVYRDFCDPSASKGYAPLGTGAGIAHPDFKPVTDGERDPTAWSAADKTLRREVFAGERWLQLLTLAEQALLLNQVSWQRDYSKGAGMIIPEISPSRDFQRLLVQHMAIAAAADDAVTWNRCLRIALTHARHHNQTPGTLIEFLVGIALEADAHKQAITDGLVLEPATIAVLAPHVDDDLLRQDILHTYLSEALCMGDWAFRTMLDDPATGCRMLGIDDDVAWLTGPLRPLILNDHAAYLTVMTSILADLSIAGAPIPDMEKAFSQHTSLLSPMTRMLAPATTMITTNAADNLRQRQFLHAVGTIQARHASTGTWPTSVPTPLPDGSAYTPSGEQATFHITIKRGSPDAETWTWGQGKIVPPMTSPAATGPKAASP